MLIYMQNIIINWYGKNKIAFADTVVLTDKEVKKGCKKIFDKLVIRIVINELENEMIISAILNLHQIERIVIVLNIIAELTADEIAFLLGTSTNNIYVQKNNALKKLRTELSDTILNRRCYL